MPPSAVSSIPRLSMESLPHDGRLHMQLVQGLFGFQH